jgi:amidase
MLGAIAGFDANDPTSLTASVPDYLANLDTGIRGLRIGIDASYSETGCDPEIIAAVREARKVLEHLGAAIKEVKVPNPEAVMVAWGSCCAVETAIAHDATYPVRAAEYGGLARCRVRPRRERDQPDEVPPRTPCL